MCKIDYNYYSLNKWNGCIFAITTYLNYKLSAFNSLSNVWYTSKVNIANIQASFVITVAVLGILYSIAISPKWSYYFLKPTILKFE